MPRAFKTARAWLASLFRRASTPPPAAPEPPTVLDLVERVIPPMTGWSALTLNGLEPTWHYGPFRPHPGLREGVTMITGQQGK